MSNETDDEKVLCVSAAGADYLISGHGEADWKLQALLNQKTYRNRKTPNDDGPPVEEDDRWKQLIPYIVVVNKDGQILAHNRGSKGGEKRLENLWAIGFGGHVNDEDSRWMDGVGREIVEELTLSRFWLDYPLDGPIGFINDDSNDVGRKHLGVVYVLRADEVTPREVPDWHWMGLDVLCLWAERGYLAEGSTNKLENWSVLALPMVREFLKGGAN